MRISDWSSDVCSSDLPEIVLEAAGPALGPGLEKGAAEFREAFGLCRHRAQQRHRLPRGDQREEAPAAIGQHLARLDLGVELPTGGARDGDRSAEHTSDLQSLMRRAYAVFCLKNNRRHN